MKTETWTATYVLPSGNRRKIEVTAEPRVIDDLRKVRLNGVAVSWKKIG